MNEYEYKLRNTLLEKIINFKNINILEFGVRKGVSTKLFLEHAKNNNCKVYSVDVVDYSNLIEDINWKFIKSRDDNFDFIKKQIPNKFKIIYLDTLHEAKHVEKIIYNYYDLLDNNGLFIIDDISHLPYLKDAKHPNFYCEINNLETFEKILEIYNNNLNNFDLSFSFIGSGISIMKKKLDSNLNKTKKIRTRRFTIKNILRKIIKNK